MEAFTLSYGGTRVYDKQLEELINTGCYKQALSLCEKRIKKGGKSEQNLAAKAQVLCLWPDPQRREQGRNELAALFCKDPAIVDTQLLASLTRFAIRANESVTDVPWERATKARPNDENIYVSWFMVAFESRAWGVAQKASIAYKTAFPQRRAPHYWYILTNYKQAGSPDIEYNVRKMHDQLNFRTIEKAVSKTSRSASTPAPGLAIENLEDLLLLLRIYGLQGKHREALAILDDDRIGIDSRVGRKAWELVRRRVDLLGRSGQLEEQWAYCRTLLVGALPEHLRDKSMTFNCVFGKLGDDWAIWDGLIAAAHAIERPEITMITEALIESFGAKSRNAQLALLKFYSSALDEGVHHQAGFLDACNSHFRTYSTKVVCFHDLKQHIFHLSPECQVQFLRASAKEARCRHYCRDEPESRAVAWLTSEINALKLDYFLVISTHPNYRNKPLVEAFVCNCLRLYKLSLALGLELPISERRPGDDAAILAVMALLHLANPQDKNDVLRCVVLLEFLLSNSRHNYDALLLQVRLALLLGTSSIAIKRYSQLSVKNVQHATLSWVFTTRISTLHPHSLSSAVNNDGPSRFLAAALDWHDSAEKNKSASIGKMMAYGQYNMVIDTLELHNYIDNGFTKFISLVEWSRGQRLGGISSEETYTELIGDWTGHAEDRRDTAAFPNCESRFQDPQARWRFDDWLALKRLNGKWLSDQLDIMWFWEYLHKRLVFESRVGLAFSQRVHGQIEVGSIWEQHECDAIVILQNLCLAYVSPDEAEKVQETMVHCFEAAELMYAGIIKGLKAFDSSPDSTLSDLGDGFSVPNWKYYHWLFTTLDLCRFGTASIYHVLTEVVEDLRVDRALLVVKCERLHRLIVEIFDLIEQVVTRQRQMLREEAAVGKIMTAVTGRLFGEQDAIGESLASLIDTENLEKISRSLCESWTDATDGLLKTKHHVWKNQKT